jgi:hypothetical protein
MAAVMAAGMTPPLGLALAALLFKNRFSLDEREAGWRDRRARHFLHHRRRDSLCGQRPAAGDSGADDRFGDNRGHLDGVRL